MRLVLFVAFAVVVTALFSACLPAVTEGDGEGEGEGEGPTACVVNDDCASDSRCNVCVDLDCVCEVGPRGVGRTGDSCTSGLDCASSLCVDDRYCSDICERDLDCTPTYPVCNGFAHICRPR